MTPAEAKLREELAALIHLQWVRAMRMLLPTIEPLIRGAKRLPENAEAWRMLDRVLLLSAKKWDCLKGDETQLPMAQAEEVLSLLRDLGVMEMP